MNWSPLAIGRVARPIDVLLQLVKDIITEDVAPVEGVAPVVVITVGVVAVIVVWIVVGVVVVGVHEHAKWVVIHGLLLFVLIRCQAIHLAIVFIQLLKLYRAWFILVDQLECSLDFIACYLFTQLL